VVSWSGRSEAFGLTTAVISTVENALRYPGQYFDSATGLHYNYFRDYEAGTGRYVQSDPIGLAGGINTYGYALQNPLVLFDLDGLKAWYCQRPLCPAGTNCTTGERGPPVMNHQYLCVTRWDGSIECGGQTSESPSPKPSPGRPTRPDEDQYNENSCDVVYERYDERCLEECLLNKFRAPRLTYAVPGPQGTDCQEWARDTLMSCKAACYFGRNRAGSGSGGPPRRR